jgi:pilus assembly protein CpaD
MKSNGSLGCWRAIALAALCALLITACDDHRRLDNATAVGLSDPERRHPIRFASRPETLDVEVPPGAEGLSPNQHIDVYRFLHHYRREAKSRLVITSPVTVRGQASIARSLQDIQRHVVEAGIDYRLLRGARHDTRSGGAPSIRLAYQRPVAVPPTCARWEEDVGRNEERIPYPNWGCVTQRNLAVMVDNGRDLTQPQPEDPRAGERRSLSWSAYVGGNPSAGGDTGDASKKGAPSTAKK